jgi:hypothetical protein
MSHPTRTMAALDRVNYSSYSTAASMRIGRKLRRYGSVGDSRCCRWDASMLGEETPPDNSHDYLLVT